MNENGEYGIRISIDNPCEGKIKRIADFDLKMVDKNK